MDQQTLQAWLTEKATELEVPGAALGVTIDGEEHYAYHGVTSVENPLDVNGETLFCYGSTGKTFTATAIMRLVEQQKVDLNAPVRTYIPELKLKDEDTAARVTVLQLLNHTSGWSGDALEDFGDGDDALTKFVASMPRLEQVTPLGSAFSYNNAALNVAGHVIAKVTGKTYEAAMKELVLDPLGLELTMYFPNDVITHRFAVGHRKNKEGETVVQRPWAMARCGAPSGGFGVSSTAPDQIAWARFHMGDGTARDGTQVLKKETLDLMKKPTFEIAGSALGDAVGISWFLEDVEGVLTVGHGGDVLGQHSAFLMVPERSFAVTVLTNVDGAGSLLNEAAVKYALEAYLGVVAEEPEPVKLDDEALAAYVGRYETIAVWVDITAADGGLLADLEVKPETLEQLKQAGQDVPDQPPIPMGLLAGADDRYIVTGGDAKGMRGYFVRGADGNVESVHVGGRIAARVKSTVPA